MGSQPIEDSCVSYIVRDIDYIRVSRPAMQFNIVYMIYLSNDLNYNAVEDHKDLM